MKRILLASAAVVIVAFPAAVLVAACSSSDRPPAGTSSGIVSPPAPTTGPDGSADADADAGVDPDAPPGPAPTCNTLVPGGLVVAATALPGSAPAPVGGTIAPGTYNLTERDYYAVVVDDDGGVTGTGLIQRVLVFDATTVNLAEGRGPNAGALVKATNASTYAVFDTVLALTATCPPPKFNTNVSFSVVGDELWLFPASGEREIYTRQ